MTREEAIGRAAEAFARVVRDMQRDGTLPRQAPAADKAAVTVERVESTERAA